MIQSLSQREDVLVNMVKAELPDIVTAVKVVRDRRILIDFKKERLLEIASFMRDRLGFDHVKGISGVDFLPQKKIELMYFIGSYSQSERQEVFVTLRTELPRETPVISSAFLTSLLLPLFPIESKALKRLHDPKYPQTYTRYFE